MTKGYQMLSDTMTVQVLFASLVANGETAAFVRLQQSYLILIPNCK